MSREKTHEYFGCFRVVTRILVTLFLIILFFSAVCNKRERTHNNAIKMSIANKLALIQSRYPQFNTEYISVIEITPRLLKLKVELSPNKKVVIDVPNEFKYGKWNSLWDNTYSNNKGRLYKIKLNNDNNLIKKEGVLLDGSGKMVEAIFINVRPHKIELASLVRDNKSTYLIVNLIK